MSCTTIEPSTKMTPFPEVSIDLDDFIVEAEKLKHGEMTAAKATKLFGHIGGQLWDQISGMNETEILEVYSHIFKSYRRKEVDEEEDEDEKICVC